jgi:thiol-disulfide isomerase/thioredoxin
MVVMSRRTMLAAGTSAACLAAGRSHAHGLASGLASLAEALKPIEPPTEAPDITFTGQDGNQHHLSEFRGRGMVINFWATWCAPCVAEMPSLSALSKTLAPADIAVLPLSSDRGGADVVGRWFQTHDVTGLPVLIDPKGEAARAFDARGIPTTVVIDREGRARAKVEGAADWSTPAAVTLIERLVNAGRG